MILEGLRWFVLSIGLGRAGQRASAQAQYVVAFSLLWQIIATKSTVGVFGWAEGRPVDGLHGWHDYRLGPRRRLDYDEKVGFRSPSIAPRLEENTDTLRIAGWA